MPQHAVLYFEVHEPIRVEILYKHLLFIFSGLIQSNSNCSLRDKCLYLRFIYRFKCMEGWSFKIRMLQSSICSLIIVALPTKLHNIQKGEFVRSLSSYQMQELVLQHKNMNNMLYRTNMYNHARKKMSQPLRNGNISTYQMHR